MPEGVYVDCGAYTGDTLLECLKCYGNRIRKCVAFEPDLENFSELNRVVQNMENVKIFQAGVWSETAEVRFVSGKLAGSKTDNSGEAADTIIKTKAIDDMPDCAEASFIKMDIEGAKLAALEELSSLLEARDQY